MSDDDHHPQGLVFSFGEIVVTWIIITRVFSSLSGVGVFVVTLLAVNLSFGE